MGKRKMNRRKEKNKEYVVNNVNIAIDYEELANAIVEANKKYDAEKEKERQERIELERREWQKIIGYEENTKNVFMKIFNRIRVLWNIMFVKKKYVKSVRITSGLMQMVACLILELFRFVFNFAIIILIAIIAFWVYSTKLYQYLFVLIWIVPLFMIERMLRLAIFEIDNMKDKEQVEKTFSATMAFTALVLSVIALFI